MSTVQLDERAARLHGEALIVDGLNVSKWGTEQFQRMKTGGITASNCTIAVMENFRETISEIATWYRYFRENTELIRPIHSVADIRRAKDEGRVGIIFGFQNTSPFEDDLQSIEI